MQHLLRNFVIKRVQISTLFDLHEAKQTLGDRFENRLRFSHCANLNALTLVKLPTLIYKEAYSFESPCIFRNETTIKDYYQLRNFEKKNKDRISSDAAVFFLPFFYVLSPRINYVIFLVNKSKRVGERTRGGKFSRLN